MSKGFTVVEMMIAVFVLSIVLLLSSQGIVTAMRVQSTQQAASANQAKLRRITEVFEQQLRGSVLGGLSQGPYAADGNSLSFVTLEGGSGFQVLSASGSALNILAPGLAASDFTGTQGLLVNQDGDAVAFNVGNASSSGAGQVTIATPGCSNMPAFSNNLRYHIVSIVGFDHDVANKELVLRTGGNDVPVAFDINNLRFDYIYLNSSGQADIQAAPYFTGNIPQKSAVNAAGDDVTLRRINVTISAETLLSSGKILERTYSSTINLGDLAGNSLVNIKGVSSCN